ncbi:MAG TPA: c-type cytochrome [Gemmatimonadales bacterium]|jgi:cytochrome c1
MAQAGIRGPWWNGQLAIGLTWLALLGACGRQAPSSLIAGGDPARGRILIVAYGCGSCHVIPGVSGASGLVGPPLTQFAHRGFIAGEVPNNSEFLVRWISVPQSIEPGTAMPNLGVSEGQARDIAAYLYTLR